MYAQKLAATLKQQGITVLSVSEGNDKVDGSIQITPLVSVTVPTYSGSKAWVVAKRDENSSWEFFPQRKRMHMSVLIADIRKACGFEA